MQNQDASTQCGDLAAGASDGELFVRMDMLLVGNVEKSIMMQHVR